MSVSKVGRRSSRRFGATARRCSTSKWIKLGANDGASVADQGVDSVGSLADLQVEGQVADQARAAGYRSRTFVVVCTNIGSIIPDTRARRQSGNGAPLAHICS